MHDMYDIAFGLPVLAEYIADDGARGSDIRDG